MIYNFPKEYNTISYKWVGGCKGLIYTEIYSPWAQSDFYHMDIIVQATSDNSSHVYRDCWNPQSYNKVTVASQARSGCRP